MAILRRLIPSTTFIALALAVMCAVPATAALPVAQTIITIAGRSGDGGGVGNGDGGQALLASLYQPALLSRDKNGNLLIAESGAFRVRKVDASGIITTFAGNGGAGSTLDNGLATAAELGTVYQALSDRAGNVYILTDANVIRKVDSNGIITTYAGTRVNGYSGDGGLATAAQISVASAAAFDQYDNLYFVDFYNHVIRKISPSGIISTIAGTGDTIYNGEGIDATAANFFYPSAIAIGGDGSIYVGDAGNAIVRKITPDGKINTIAGTPNSAGYSGDGGAATAAQLNSICSIALDSAGNVYFCDGANNRVRKISADGIIYTIVGNGVNANSGDGGLASQASINGPHGAFVDSDGSVLISSYSGGVVRKIFAPSLSLSASATVPQPGQSVTFTAQLVDATLTGTMTFRHNGVDISGCVAVPITAGQALCTSSFSGAGSHQITAGYSGAEILPRPKDGAYATIGAVASLNLAAQLGTVTFTALLNSATAALGSITPEGDTVTQAGNRIGFSITAAPRHVIRYASDCNFKQTSPVLPFVPIGTGTQSYLTESLYSSCRVEAAFVPLIPKVQVASQVAANAFLIDVARRNEYVAPPTVATTSSVGRAMMFTAWVIDIAGVPYPSASNVITFFANDLPIEGCVAMPLNFSPSAVRHIRIANCTTTFASAKNVVITARFAGDTYNFPASSDGLNHRVVAAP
jgi:Bacterial Ig-like domain (group 3)